MILGLVTLSAILIASGDVADTPTAYDDDGRRDPFVDPLGDPLLTAERRPGLGGQRIGEVRLQGVSRIGREPVALLLGGDGIGYLAREGDDLADGRVIAIDFAAAELTLRTVPAGSEPAATRRLRLGP